MGTKTNIEWTDHSFSPWIGCTKVSPGCKNCYAETLDNRYYGGTHWGKGKPRSVIIADAFGSSIEPSPPPTYS